MENIILKTEKFVVQLLNEHLDHNYVYHNLAHTQHVVASIKTLSTDLELNDTDKEHLELAAWLHDTGFTKGHKAHEKESVKIASDFLKAQQYPDPDIEIVLNLILATEVNREPTHLLEKLMRDADSSHIGSKRYLESCELLRREWELTCDKVLTESEWLKENIHWLTTQHKFYSDIAATKWEERKSKNLAQLLKKQNKVERDNIKLQQKKDQLKFKKNKIELPERGIETMFRVALRNHITLSDIADTKANILLSVNAIIISLVISNLISKLDNPSNGYLILPTAIFALFTVVSIVLSVLATRPNVTRGKFTKEDVANKKVNLLFFGNFHKMKLDEFEWAMSEMMQDRDYLYGSLTKDLYFLGLVLNRKYKLLRITYTVFMVGIIVSVIAFVLAFQLSGIEARPIT
ncbi:Pycsar system effector family protein [Winogradskyella sediminis]|uniref:Predicted metal-dependent phosphohydrolase, HD superfamily n=1 Tax=Winogradskyella sediminis TaxID=1382466 RepID=A0A1H1QH08_9FLAO|nr:Pycsar system effector family protein [Winogradskyella sediminis]REG89792.1 putative metal-dependent HD superfamily phosphohydrolase [Winogradskyella sediminis]SDS22603.1 Predicted metal-dependent phosphohydrolase, HD superfamily [Winogradskyella sediminis]